MRRPMLAATMLLTFLGTAALAQSAADHGAHHPDQKDAPAVGPVTPPAAPRSTAPSPGKMGGNMQMPDMMRMMGMMRQSGTDCMAGADGRHADARQVSTLGASLT